MSDGLAKPCSRCGTLLRPYADDDGYPFEEPVFNGPRVTHYVHSRDRCAELRAEPCESCGTLLRPDRDAYGPSEWQWELVGDPLPEAERLAKYPHSKNVRRHRPHDHERCAEMRVRT